MVESLNRASRFTKVQESLNGHDGIKKPYYIAQLNDIGELDISDKTKVRLFSNKFHSPSL